MNTSKLFKGLAILLLFAPVMLTSRTTASVRAARLALKLKAAQPLGAPRSPNDTQASNDSTIQSTAAFSVTQVTPANAAINIPLDATVGATFSLPVDSRTVSTHTFTVRGDLAGVYAGSYSGVLSGTLALGVQFGPAQDFKPNEEVVVNLSSGIRAGDGTPLKPYAWQFRATVLGGSGVFSEVDPGMDSTWSNDLALGDLDGDGDLDVFVGHRDYASTVWFNDGKGAFTTSGVDLVSQSVNGVKLGDLDGDGDLDAFVANVGDNTVWLNDGKGTFKTTGQSLGYNEASFDVALGDVDGDGDLDAFVANAGEMFTDGRANDLWLNDGRGIFNRSSQALGESHSTSAVLGDLDGDGDLDAFVTNYLGQPNTVWLNDGAGAFTKTQGLGDRHSMSVALGDLDDDGDLDAFVANWNQEPNTVWRNDGTGTFSSTGQDLGSAESLDVALGDFDGDGDLDAFIANGGLGQPNTVWLNDGTGAFKDSGQSLGSAASQASVLGDVDADGDLDAFVTNHDHVIVLWLNQGLVYLPLVARGR